MVKQENGFLIVAFSNKKTFKMGFWVGGETAIEEESFSENDNFNRWE